MSFNDKYNAGLDILGALPRLSPLAAGAKRPAPARSLLQRAVTALTPGAQGGVAPRPTAKAAAAKPSTAMLQKTTAAASKATSSAQRLLAATQKMAKHNPRLAQKLAGVATKHLARAKSAGTMSSAAVAAHRVMGDMASVAMTALDPVAMQAAIYQMIAQGSEDDALATLVVDYNDLASYVDQLTSINQTALVSSGNALLTQMENLGNNYDPNTGDPSLPGKVASVDASYQKWLNGDASAALNKAMASGALVPPPGSPNAPPAGSTGGGAATGVKPVISSLSASNGAPGDSITVTGTGLYGVESANFNGVAATITPISATQMQVQVPQGATLGPLNVITPGGEASAPFTINAPGAAPFDPGTAGGGGGYGGGGGGGGYDDGGDGFDTGDGGGAGGGYDDTGDGGDQGAADEGAATGDESEMDTGDSEDYQQAVADFRQSGIDPFEDGGDTGDTADTGAADAVEGDYNPWALLYDPAGELYRSYTVHSAPGAYQAATAPGRAPTGMASGAAAARLAASKQRLASLQAQLDAFRLQQAQGVAYVPPTAQDYGTANGQGDATVMGDETLRQFRQEGVDPFEEHDVVEDDDVAIEQFKDEITDEEPDWERRKGSVHRGASYMQYNEYPPHGTSGGQEGGVADNEEYTIVFGGVMDPRKHHSHYSRGMDILGATPRGGLVLKKGKAPPQAAGFVIKKSPLLKRPFSSLVVRKGKHDPKVSIQNARAAGKRAVSLGNKLITLATKTNIHGAIARKPIRAALTAVKLKQLAKDVVKKGNAALKGADKHEKLRAKNASRVQSGVKAARALTHIHGDERHDIIFGLERDAAYAEMLHIVDDDVDIFGYGDIAIYGQDASNPPDPNNPGYLMDGSPDPSASAGAGAGVAGPPDYGIGPPPTSAPPLVAGQDYDPDPGPDNDFNFYSSDPGVGQAMGLPISFVPLPVGAVIYDGTLKPAYMDFGSFTTYKGTLPSGQPAGGPGSGYQWHDDGWWSYRSGDDPGPAGSGDLRLKHADDSSPGSMYARVANSYNYNWGPLIGNPNGTSSPWARGLRYDVGGGQWFWFRDQAPSWATAADDAARLNQATLDYQAQVAAAAADAAAQAAQDQLDAAQAAALTKQQAQEDQVQAHQLQQQQAQAEADAQVQALADEAAARQTQTESEAYSAQAQADAQAQAMLEQSQALTEAKIEQQAEETAARLEAMQPPSADEGDTGDEGDYGYADAGDAGDAGEGDVPTADDTVLGLRGTARLKDRIRRRRG